MILCITSRALLDGYYYNDPFNRLHNTTLKVKYTGCIYRVYEGRNNTLKRILVVVGYCETVSHRQ